LWIEDFNLVKASEVGGIEGQDLADSIHIHHGDKARVVGVFPETRYSLTMRSIPKEFHPFRAGR
jgi:hypothetical protein